jgi:hypothetical protein
MHRIPMPRPGKDYEALGGAGVCGCEVHGEGGRPLSKRAFLRIGTKEGQGDLGDTCETREANV